MSNMNSISYVKEFNINGIVTKQVACIELQGAPNAATAGAVGVFGMDVTSPTHEVYKCVAVNGSVYTWELVSAGMSILSSTITGEGGERKSFPYTSLLMPAKYLIKNGDLILDSKGYLYQIDTIGAESCEAFYCGTQIGGIASGDKNCTLRVKDGKLQLVTESGNVLSSVDYFLPDGKTTYRKDDTGEIKVIGVESIDGTNLQLFVGTQEEYDVLPDDVKAKVIPIVRRGLKNSLWEDAKPSPAVESALKMLMGDGTVGLAYAPDGDRYVCTGLGSAEQTDIKITQHIVGHTVDKIEQNAFKDCVTIKSVTVPNNVTNIGLGAFQGCTSLEKITLPFVGEGVNYHAYLGRLFGARSYTENNVYVPKNLKTVRITDGSSIGSLWFDGCSSLTSIELYEGIKYVYSYNFEGCSSLESINVDVDNKVYKSINGILFSKDGETLCVYPRGRTSFEIPENVKIIGSYSFAGTDNLETIYVPKNVESIDGDAFKACVNLTTVNFAEGSLLTHIWGWAFTNCVKLSSIEIPEGVFTIGEFAFQGCESLESIRLPATITEIHQAAFADCTSLREVYYSGSREDWANIDIGEGNVRLEMATIYFAGDELEE